MSGDAKIQPLADNGGSTETYAIVAGSFGILAALAEHPGEVFSREDLVRKVWGEGYTADSISIPVYVHRIREKIEQEPTNPQYLQTVWRVGYRLGD